MKPALTEIQFPAELPITQQQEAIAKAIINHQVVIIAGETGSGKTTQLPKICLQLGMGKEKLIGHTQPRRIAARTVASRIAQELKCELGAQIGFQMRFTDKVSAATYVKVMTDGILLAEIQRDKLLQRYEVLIIDEAHERSLNIDFLLGYLKTLLPKRPDLKLIITSATINPQQFSRYFFDAPIIEVKGRTYPVEVRYRPAESDQLEAINMAVDELWSDKRGDILVFLSSEREIRDTAEVLRKRQRLHCEILPLYARLSLAEQNKIFSRHTGNRIVLATNVAETSLTVPGIRYVIDTGYARLSRYSYRSKVQRLPIEPISQASADQRKGRCGREAAGICLRLYSQEDFTNRPAFTEPEILRTNLAAVILQMANLRLGDVYKFPFLDKPDPRAIRAAYRLLFELQAMDKQGSLTSLGKQLASLPIEPRFARMLLAAVREDCLDELLIIVSGLSVQDPRERPHDKQQAAAEKHRQFLDVQSDFMSILKLWQHLHAQKSLLSNNQMRKYCQEHFISYLRWQEWGDIYRQLRLQTDALQFNLNKTPANYQAIHRSILTGALSQTGFKLKGFEYLGTHSRRFYIFPGSAIAKKPPAWIVAAELLDTSKLYAHTIAGIQPEWLEEMASHLLSLHYYEPYWQESQGYVGAYAKVSLYGLLVNPRRKVNYGPIEPVVSREIFIREALVQGRLRLKLDFLKHNLQSLAEMEYLEDKTRRRDLTLDEYKLYDFYDKHIPAGIYSLALFQQWYKAASQAKPNLLFLSQDELKPQQVAISDQAFPDDWQLDGLCCKLSYLFEPGHSEDGVSIELPLAQLNRVPKHIFDWLVPGLLLEKMTALLKALPKSLRRYFVPVPEFARACFEALSPADRPLTQAMAEHLAKISGVKIPADSWQLEQLPLHLLMNFKIVDAHGQQVATGRNLASLKEKLQTHIQAELADIPAIGIERSHITAWDFGDLPKEYAVKTQQNLMTVYPALVDKGESVAIELFAEQLAADKQHTQGLVRLFYLASAQQLSYLRKNIACLSKLSLLFTTIGSKEQLLDDLCLAAIKQTFLDHESLLYDAKDFAARLAQGKGRLIEVANDSALIVERVLQAYQACLKSLANHPLAPTIKLQLAELVFPGFINLTPHRYLLRLPIYLQAIPLRLTKYWQNPKRDQQLAEEIEQFWHAYSKLKKSASPEATEFRWLLEEYRISAFAQSLKTLVPISAKRLKQLLDVLQSD
jgi:ATP-dependent helicase HrpA